MEKPKKIALNILTPTTVGSGEVMSAYTDYFIRDGQAVYVDHQRVRDRLRQLIPQQPDIVTEYMAEVTGKMNSSGNRSEARLGEFLEERLSLPLNSFEEKYPFKGKKLDDEKVQIYRTVRNANEPYLPGSSVKGALVTVILYGWLLDAQNGQDALSNIAQDIESTHDKQTPALQLREQLFAEGRQHPKNDEGKLLIKNWKYAVKELDRRIDQQFEKLFGRMSKEKPMDFSALRVGDSSPLAASNLVVQMVKRFSYRDGSFGIPQLRECLNISSAGYLTLQVLQHDSGFSEIPWLNHTDPLPALFKAVNRFSLANLRHDQRQFDRYLNRNPQMPADQRKLADFFLAQIKYLENAPTNTCRLRLGAGKTYFYNSIGLALLERHPEAFANWINLAPLGNPGQKHFPVTRVLTDPGFEPTGWVEFNYKN